MTNFGEGNTRDLQTRVQRNLNRRRFKEADIKDRSYVGPFGDTGLHRVKSRATSAVYVVSGPARTFRPDTQVPAGSHTATQGEVLLTPMPAKRGASAPIIIEESQGLFPIITSPFGEHTFPSSGFPHAFTSSIIGINFSPSNSVSILYSEIRDYDGESSLSVSESNFSITGLTFIDSTEWEVELLMVEPENMTWRFQVCEGALCSNASNYLDPSDGSEGRWRLLGE